MSVMFCNRRRMLAFSGLSLGSLFVAANTALADDDADLKRKIRTIIFEHFPAAQGQEPVVDKFVSDLLNERLEKLEPKPFLATEVRKVDHSALERYVIVQFVTSEAYIASQEK